MRTASSWQRAESEVTVSRVGEELQDPWPYLRARLFADHQTHMIETCEDFEMFARRADHVEQAFACFGWRKEFVCGACNHQHRHTQLFQSSAVVSAVITGPMAFDVPGHPLRHDTWQLVFRAEA